MEKRNYREVGSRRPPFKKDSADKIEMIFGLRPILKYAFELDFPCIDVSELLVHV